MIGIRIRQGAELRIGSRDMRHRGIGKEMESIAGRPARHAHTTAVAGNDRRRRQPGTALTQGDRTTQPRTTLGDGGVQETLRGEHAAGDRQRTGSAPDNLYYGRPRRLSRETGKRLETGRDETAA